MFRIHEKFLTLPTQKSKFTTQTDSERITNDKLKAEFEHELKCALEHCDDHQLSSSKNEIQRVLKETNDEGNKWYGFDVTDFANSEFNHRVKWDAFKLHPGTFYGDYVELKYDRMWKWLKDFDS